MSQNKEFFYVMDFGRLPHTRKRIIKPGTSNDPKRRLKEHEVRGNKFLKGREGKILVAVPLSKYNALRVEDRTREKWDNTPGFERAPRCLDTFLVDTEVVQEISFTVKKTYSARIA